MKTSCLVASPRCVSACVFVCVRWRAQPPAVAANGVVCLFNISTSQQTDWVSGSLRCCCELWFITASIGTLPSLSRSRFNPGTSYCLCSAAERDGEAAESAVQRPQSAEPRRREAPAAGRQPQRAAQRVSGTSTSTLVVLVQAEHTLVILVAAVQSPLVLLVQHGTSNWFHLSLLHSPLELEP